MSYKDNIMKLLITGGFGFIGSTLIRHILDTTNFEVINIDSKTSTSMPESLNSYKHLQKHLNSLIHNLVLQSPLTALFQT